MDKDNSYDYVQKSWTVEYKVRIEEDGIKYYMKNLEDTLDVFIHFLEIEEKKRIRYQTTNTMDGYLYSGLLIVWIVTISLMIANRGNLITTIIGILSIGFGVAGFWIYRVKEIGIPITNELSTEYINFFENKPKKEYGMEIINSIYKARAKYLKDHFFKIIDENSKEFEVGRMEWLFKEDVITKSEYEFMIELINNTMD